MHFLESFPWVLVWFLSLFYTLVTCFLFPIVGEMLLSKVPASLAACGVCFSCQDFQELRRNQRWAPKTPAKGWNIWSWKSITCSFNKNSLLCEIPRDLLQPGLRHCLVWTNTAFGEEGGKKAAKGGVLKCSARQRSQPAGLEQDLFPSGRCSGAAISRSVVSAMDTSTSLVSYVFYL